MPDNRGWQTFHGFYTSHIDYATKILKTNKWVIGVYDWGANGEVDYDTIDTYSTIAMGDKIQTLASDHIAINEENNDNKPFFMFGGIQVTHTPVRQHFCENVLRTDVFGDLMTFLR